MVWSHWKLRTKTEENCSGRSRVRRIFSLVNTKYGEKLVIFAALFKSLLFFQCSWNMHGIFIGNWSRDCEIYKKIYRAVFWKMRNLWAWTKLCAKTVTKAAECTLIKFFLLAIAQSNSPLFLYAAFNGIKPLWDEAAIPKLIIFLKY